MAASNNLHSIFTEMLENQVETDVVLKLIDSSGSSELLNVHKLILSAASPVFKAMFSEKWTINGNPLEINDVDIKLFKLFIRIIYHNRLPDYDLEYLETFVALYELAHRYQTSYVIQLLSKDMKTNCYSENVILCANVAWPYKDKELRKACKKVFAVHAMKVLETDFFKAKPSVVNTFYSLDPMTIDSEATLVQKLDEYIMKNQDQISDLMQKLTPAIENIRYKFIKKSVIDACEVQIYKNVLIKKKSDASYALKNGTLLVTNRRKKATLLSFLPPEMLQVLFSKFINMPNSNSNDSYLKYFYDNATLRNMYASYKHTNLNLYSNDEINIILKELKKQAIREGDQSEYKIFLDYEEYLIPLLN